MSLSVFPSEKSDMLIVSHIVLSQLIFSFAIFLSFFQESSTLSMAVEGRVIVEWCTGISVTMARNQSPYAGDVTRRSALSQCE